MLKNKKKILIFIALIVMLTFNFMTNFLSIERIGGYPFNNFQKDSENLVIWKMNYDKLNNVKGNCDYGLCTYDYTKDTFNQYTSQFGLQGYIFSFLNNNLNVDIKILHIFTCLLLSTTLVLICYFINKKYDKLLGIIFYITFFLSPWIIAFARNLYWVPFTWFIPSLLGLLFSIYYKEKKIFIPLIYLSILIKCLCGYEYITTIMLSTIIYFVIDLFVVDNKKARKKILATIFAVGIVCLLGFGTSLIIHGYKRGDGNIYFGVREIYKKDVLKRTILTFDKDNYTGIMYESMDASIKDVIKLYIYNWSTDIIYGLNSKLFPIMIIVTFIICVINYINKKEHRKRDLMMFIMFLLTSISWFILGKSHSYIHTHMNYVLWYFGFIQICIYIILKFILNKIKAN